MSGDAVIRVRGLRKRYGSFEAVRDVDLDVRAGEVLACLGPNGAGKTTTVEILEGYRSRGAGEVSVLGEDPARGSRAWRARIGVVLQEAALEEHLTVREALTLFASYYPRPRGIDEVIALAGLEEKADARLGRLSGGQRRRADVALALVGGPELIFLDEPTTGFDPTARRQAWETVAGLRELGTTVLLTTHYLEEAEALADRIVVLAGGGVVAEGTPATLGGREGAASRIAFTLPSGVQPPRGAQREGAKTVLRAQRPLAAVADLAAWAQGHGLELADLEVRRPSLEEIYLGLVSDGPP
jgi:ABC-2 type transport system ATP-binding protein